jgi:hypothetical protein
MIILEGRRRTVNTYEGTEPRTLQLSDGSTKETRAGDERSIFDALAETRLGIVIEDEYAIGEQKGRKN